LRKRVFEQGVFQHERPRGGSSLNRSIAENVLPHLAGEATAPISREASPDQENLFVEWL
jgi:hypothetical protein